MFLPADPIVTMLFVFGYIFFCVIRGVFSSLNNPKVSNEEFMKMYHQMIEDREEEERYYQWLYKHRPKEE